MSATNPLSRGYAQIIAALGGYTPLVPGVVKLANVQDMQRQGFKVRTNIAAADRPEIRVLEGRLRSKPFSGNSLSVFFDCIYPIAIASGSQSPDKNNLIAVMLLQALTTAGVYLGLHQSDIIQKWEMVDATMVPEDKPTGRPDWTIKWGVLVSFAIKRQDFIAASFT